MSNLSVEYRKKSSHVVEKLAKTAKPQTFKKDPCCVYNKAIKQIEKQYDRQEE